MDLRLNNPDLQAKLNRWVTETGRAPDELVEDAMAGYFDELARTHEMLIDGRAPNLPVEKGTGDLTPRPAKRSFPLYPEGIFW